ncbi:iron-sulfur cluster assembly accessory protein [SAR202 cluster bacterium AD-804-J14_MRT_500m]|nr:iron-sulfur cluster assembly accessory protein [SAR202 cluster bacterium AD-804-J14_MRT_500m]
MLEVTTMAADKIKEVLEEEGKQEIPLRVIAMPDGQGSVQYMLSLENEGQEDDVSMELAGIKFLVDADSVPFVEKATIDFVEDFTKVGFVISNPDYPTSSGCGGGGCGCGSGGGGCGSEGGGGGCGCGAGSCGGH